MGHPIPTNLGLEWKNLLTGLLKAQPFRFNRYYFYNNSSVQLKNVSLHCFCDTNKNAYAAVIYFLSENIHDEKYCSLVAAKTKVPPIKNVSISKFELLACVLLTNLIRYVISSMENVLAFTVGVTLLMLYIGLRELIRIRMLLLITELVKFVR